MSEVENHSGEAPLFALTATQLDLFTASNAVAAVRQRLDKTDPAINAVIAVDWVIAQAAEAESTARWHAASPLSPLDGVPSTIKDNLNVARLPATWGGAAYRDYAPEDDEPAVAPLREAGAVMLGKPNAPEFTLQGYTSNALFGATHNPHALSRTPGGSTGDGAAAVAAGMGPIAIGTDGGGSIRPAAHRGLFALKPSIGQITRSIGLPPILSDFEAVGPIARSVEDLITAFSIWRRYDPRDPRSLANFAPRSDFPRGLRIGYFPRIGSAPVDPEIAQASDEFAKTLAADGCKADCLAPPFDVETINAAWVTIASASLAWHLRRLPHDQVSLGADALCYDGDRSPANNDRLSRRACRCSPCAGQRCRAVRAFRHAALPRNCRASVAGRRRISAIDRGQAGGAARPRYTQRQDERCWLQFRDHSHPYDARRGRHWNAACRGPPEATCTYFSIFSLQGR
jgi:Asp-tRNA(Asn)/Glu-tRNA(Gln) amidotransferase A subunit family amidase